MNCSFVWSTVWKKKIMLAAVKALKQLDFFIFCLIHRGWKFEKIKIDLKNMNQKFMLAFLLVCFPGAIFGKINICMG